MSSFNKSSISVDQAGGALASQGHPDYISGAGAPPAKESDLSLATMAAMPFILSSIGNPKLTRWASRAIAGYSVVKFLVSKWPKSQNPKVTNIYISEDSEMFPWVSRWVSQQKLPKRTNSFRAALEVTRTGKPDGSWQSNLVFNPHDAIDLDWNGTRIFIDATSASAGPMAKSDDGFFRIGKSSYKIVIGSRDMKIIRKLFDEIRQIGEVILSVRTPMVYTWNHWEWTPVKKCPTNRMPVLPAETFERVRKDLETFLSEQEWYQSVSVPYQRRYLFEGVPGSGKTTLAQSLCGQFGLDLFCIHPNSFSDDEGLIKAWNQIRQGSVALIEDVDRAGVPLQEGDEQKPVDQRTGSKISTSGLMNCLDGALTPEGQVCILTTNYVNRLPPSLIREGRVDLTLKFENANFDQVFQLARRFNVSEGEATSMAAEWSKEEISMAKVQGRLIEIHKAKR